METVTTVDNSLIFKKVGPELRVVEGGFKSAPVQGLAVSNKFGLTFFINCKGFCVAYTNELVKASQQSKAECNAKDISITSIELPSVHALVLSKDEDVIAVCESDKIHLYNVPALVKKEQASQLLKTITISEDKSGVKAVEWNPIHKETVLVLSRQGKLMVECLVDELKFDAEDVEAASWSPDGVYLCYITKDKNLHMYKTDLSSNSSSKLPSELFGDAGADGHAYVDSVKWVCLDSILISCVHQDDDGEEDDSWVFLLVSNKGHIAKDHGTAKLLILEQFIATTDPSILPPRCGPYLLTGYVQPWKVLIAASRRSIDEHIAVLGWLQDGAHQEPCRVVPHDDAFAARIEMQASGDDNSVIGLAIDHTIKSIQLPVPGADSGEKLLPGPILLLLTVEGNLILYSVGRLGPKWKDIEVVSNLVQLPAPEEVPISYGVEKSEKQQTVSLFPSAGGSKTEPADQTKDLPKVIQQKETGTVSHPEQKFELQGIAGQNSEQRLGLGSNLGQKFGGFENFGQKSEEKVGAFTSFGQRPDQKVGGFSSFGQKPDQKLGGFASFGQQPDQKSDQKVGGFAIFGQQPDQKPDQKVGGFASFGQQREQQPDQKPPATSFGPMSGPKLGTHVGSEQKSEQAFGISANTGQKSEQSGVPTMFGQKPEQKSGVPTMFGQKPDQKSGVPIMFGQKPDQKVEPKFGFPATGLNNFIQKPEQKVGFPATAGEKTELKFGISRFGQKPEQKPVTPSTIGVNVQSTAVPEFESEFDRELRKVKEMRKEIDDLVAFIEGNTSEQSGLSKALFTKSMMLNIESDTQILSLQCQDFRDKLMEQKQNILDLRDESMQVDAWRVYVQSLLDQASDVRYQELWNKQKLHPEMDAMRKRILNVDQSLKQQIAELEEHLHNLELSDWQRRQNNFKSQAVIAAQNSEKVRRVQSLYDTVNTQMLVAKQLSQQLSYQMEMLRLPSVPKEELESSSNTSFLILEEHTSKKVIDHSSRTGFSLNSAEEGDFTPMRMMNSSLQTPTKGDATVGARSNLQDSTRRRRDSVDKLWVDVGAARTTVKRAASVKRFDGLSPSPKKEGFTESQAKPNTSPKFPSMSKTNSITGSTSINSVKTNQQTFLSKPDNDSMKFAPRDRKSYRDAEARVTTSTASSKEVLSFRSAEVNQQATAPIANTFSLNRSMPVSESAPTSNFIPPTKSSAASPQSLGVFNTGRVQNFSHNFSVPKSEVNNVATNEAVSQTTQVTQSAKSVMTKESSIGKPEKTVVDRAPQTIAFPNIHSNEKQVSSTSTEGSRFFGQKHETDVKLDATKKVASNTINDGGSVVQEELKKEGNPSSVVSNAPPSQPSKEISPFGLDKAKTPGIPFPSFSTTSSSIFSGISIQSSSSASPSTSGLFGTSKPNTDASSSSLTASNGLCNTVNSSATSSSVTCCSIPASSSSTVFSVMTSSSGSISSVASSTSSSSVALPTTISSSASGTSLSFGGIFNSTPATLTSSSGVITSSTGSLSSVANSTSSSIIAFSTTPSSSASATSFSFGGISNSSPVASTSSSGVVTSSTGSLSSAVNSTSSSSAALQTTIGSSSASGTSLLFGGTFNSASAAETLQCVPPSLLPVVSPTTSFSGASTSSTFGGPFGSNVTSITSAAQGASMVKESNPGVAPVTASIVAQGAPTVSDEEDMEEEVNSTSTFDLGATSFSAFGLGSSTAASGSQVSNPFGASLFPNQSSSASQLSTPSGQLFRPPSFSVPAPQSPSTDLFKPASFSIPASQSTPPASSSPFGSLSTSGAGSGFGTNLFSSPAQQSNSGFGQTSQPVCSGQATIGSALGSFGQTRQIGAPFGGSSSYGFGKPASVGGFANVAATGGGFAAAAMCCGGGFAGAASGGFAGAATGGGGFAGAATGGGFAGAATGGGGFAGAATGGGGFAGAATGGGFAGAATGSAFGCSATGSAGGGGFGGFGGSTVSGSPSSGNGYGAFGGGSFSSFGSGSTNSTLFTQMRK